MCPSGGALATEAAPIWWLAPPLVLDDDLLSPRLAQPLPDGARETVAHAARRRRHQDGDGPGGIRLCGRDAAPARGTRARSAPADDFVMAVPSDMAGAICRFCSRMTLPHLCVSALMYSANSSGELVIGSNNCGVTNCSWNAGSAMILPDLGVDLHHDLARRARGGEQSEPGSGRIAGHALGGGRHIGRRGRRFGLPMPRIFTLPARAAPAPGSTLTDIMLMWPPMTSVSAGAAPR